MSQKIAAVRETLREERQYLADRVSQPVKRLLSCLFPLFLMSSVYLNLAQNWEGLLTQLRSITWASVGVFVYTAALLFLFYFLLVMIVRRAWIAALIVSLPVYILSIADAIKYQTLGVRINFDDVKMLLDITHLWSPSGGGSSVSFAYILSFALVGAYILLLALLRVRIQIRRSRTIALGTVLALFFTFTFSTKGVALYVLSPQVQVMQKGSSTLDDEAAPSPVSCFLGTIYYSDEEPTFDERYTAGTVRQSILDLKTPVDNSGALSDEQLPDVLVIMSESYFDLRTIPGVEVDESVYHNLDRLKAEKRAGKLVVPTFGGGTCTSEFEVLTGIANRSLNNARYPFKVINEENPVWSFANYFTDLGYETTYVHPYKRYFYDRNDSHPAMGFENMIFDDNMTVDAVTYGYERHISDASFVDQLMDVLDSGSGDTRQFVFGVSIQNHSPYLSENGTYESLVAAEGVSQKDLDAMNFYAQGIADTDREIGRLLSYVDSRERPTVLVFFGDHHPLLDGCNELAGLNKDNIYDRIENITTEYFVYTNFEMRDSLPATRLSAFYLMSMVTELTGLPQTAYTRFLNATRKEHPIYTMEYPILGTEQRYGDLTTFSEKLDMLAYDRVYGQKYSVLS